MFIVTNLMSALIGTLCFYIASQPQVVGVINNSGTMFDGSGCITGAGHIGQTFIFLILLLVLSLIVVRNKSIINIVLYSIMAALLFYIISDTDIYRLVDRYVGYGYSCNSTHGLIIHSILYGIMLYGGSLIL